MAVNRFPTYAMRDSSYPEGFPDLPPHRQVKVDLGNGLAVVTVHLGHAQEDADGRWMFEQPWTSIMMQYKPVKDFLQRPPSFRLRSRFAHSAPRG